MYNLKSLVRRASRFSVAELCTTSGLPRRTVYSILSGESMNPKMDTLASLDKAVCKLELQETKKKSAGKTAKIQTPSRYNRRRPVAGKGA